MTKGKFSHDPFRYISNLRSSIIVAKALLAPLRAWLEYLDGDSTPSLPHGLARNVIDACVAMCSSSNLNDGRLALRIGKKLRSNTTPLSTRLMLAKAESVYERSSGLENLSSSDDIALEAIDSANASGGEIDALSKYAVAQLLFSLTENSLLRNEFEYAYAHVNRVTWLPDEDDRWSTLMLRLTHAKYSVLGRVLRYKGDFEQARDVLEKCLNIGQGARMLNQDNIRRHLADVYCELGKTEMVFEMLRPRLDELEGEQREHSRVYRRLALPYADACARNGHSDTALRLWRMISDHFRKQPATNSTDELDHLRTAIALICWAHETQPLGTLIAMITDALDMIARYQSFTEPNYYKGLLLQARGHACERLARADRECAVKCDPGPRYFIPFIGTGGLEKLMRRS